jgi:hypothetical protein
MYVNLFGWPMHLASTMMNRLGTKARSFRHQYLPWYFVQASGEYRNMNTKQRIELEKMITFDALTPAYDNPMTTDELINALKRNNISIVSLEDGMISPVYATGQKATTK